MSRDLHITAPSRLHFGLWSLGAEVTGVGERRQFGGVGAMINRPCVELRMVAGGQFGVSGPSAARAAQFARRWSEFHSVDLPHCNIEILQAIPEHAGLGSGTQLALSVAAGLSALVAMPEQTVAELARSVGRGLRSAVGTYGFGFGGLIVERGKLADDAISPLDCRIDLPEEWRFALIRPIGVTGLAGEDETAAFGGLPVVPRKITNRLIAEVNDRLVPGAATADFPMFAQSLYEYGRLSGECFAARQGGPFNGPMITSIIERIRAAGYEGVGQSSWGPTIFVVIESQAAAEEFFARFQKLETKVEAELLIASPHNQGARVLTGGVGELAHSG